MVDSALMDYIKDGLKKGYSEEELKRILKDNGWTSLEISEAFNTMHMPPQSEIQQRPVQQTARPLMATSPNKDLLLENFVKQAMNRGFSEEKIRQALLAKKWPLSKINSILSRYIPKQPVTSTKEIKPKNNRPPISINYSKILVYFMWFVLVSGILSLSIGVFYYIQGISDYTITDPNTGEQITGFCLQEDCSDMKDYIFDQIKNSIWVILGIAFTLSLILIMLHAFIPQKEWVIWIADILFFLYIVYLLFLWFR